MPFPNRESKSPAATAPPPTSMRVVWAARLLVLGILGIAAYGYWEGIPDDVVGLVNTGNVDGLKRQLARDPESVHTKVYPQAVSTPSARNAYRTRTGRDPWEGRYLIHQAVDFTGNLEVLDVLAAAGADLKVRLNGKTLLHLAAEEGNLDVARWLIDHGADLNARIDCDECPERGNTPLHSGLSRRADEMSELLLSRGAALEAEGAGGRTPMLAAAARGTLGGALVLARHGADMARPDDDGRTAFDLAGIRQAGTTITDGELRALADWFKPGGRFATVSAAAQANRSTLGDEYARRLMDDVLAKERASATAPAAK